MGRYNCNTEWVVFVNVRHLLCPITIGVPLGHQGPRTLIEHVQYQFDQLQTIKRIIQTAEAYSSETLSIVPHMEWLYLRHCQ
jgi:hypothetical protein